MKRVLALLTVLLFLCAAINPASARRSSSTGSHSSKSGNYIVRHCKTNACFKKHPSGTYGFVSGKHKRK